MTITLKGIYRDGKIDLHGKPAMPEGTEVLVTIEAAPQANAQGQQIYRGMFAKPGARDATWEDFEEAKRIWEPKDPE